MATMLIPTIERPAFFEGQRLTAADLAAALDYERELRWLNNRSLHGWGIAVGYRVIGLRGARSVTVGPGYALDRLGRDVVLEQTAELAVPPVAGPQTWDLTASYLDDAELTSELRTGACGTRGAVRLMDEPRLRWLDSAGNETDQVQPGLDLVLATATVRGCRLEREVSVAGRRQLARAQPYVFAGQTARGATPWTASAAGVTTTVSTAAAGFLGTPSYQARLGGVLTDARGLMIETSAYLERIRPDSFEFRVVVHGAVADPALARELEWHVVWLGVEAG